MTFRIEKKKAYLRIYESPSEIIFLADIGLCVRRAAASPLF